MRDRDSQMAGGSSENKGATSSGSLDYARAFRPQSLPRSLLLGCLAGNILLWLPFFILRCLLWSRGLRTMDLWGSGLPRFRPLPVSAVELVPFARVVTWAFVPAVLGMLLCAVLVVVAFRRGASRQCTLAAFLAVSFGTLVFVCFSLGFTLAGI